MKLPESALLQKVGQGLSYADEDLRVAGYDLSMPEAPPWRVIAFHTQQSAQKCLKAYPVFDLTDFPHTHNLRRPLDLCAAHASWAEQLRDAEELTLATNRKIACVAQRFSSPEY